MPIFWNPWKPYLAEGALLLLVVGVVWVGLGPLEKSIERKRDQVQELQVLSEYRERQSALLPELEEQYQFIVENAATLDITTSKDKIVDFVRTLEMLADTVGVKVTIASRDNALLESKTTIDNKTTVDATGNKSAPSAKKDPRKETGLLAELPLPDYLRLDVTVTGPYIALAQYLNKLETLPFALDVVGIEIREVEEEAPATPPVRSPFVPGETPVTPELPPAPVTPTLDATFDTVLYLTPTPTL